MFGLILTSLLKHKHILFNTVVYLKRKFIS